MAEDTSIPLLSTFDLNSPQFASGLAQVVSTVLQGWLFLHFKVQLTTETLLLVILPLVAGVNGVIGGVISRLVKAWRNPANLASASAAKVATALPITQDAASVAIPSTPPQK